MSSKRACALKGCPTVVQHGKRHLVVIGKTIAPDDLRPDLRQRISAGEVAVLIPAQCLEDYLKTSSVSKIKK